MTEEPIEEIMQEALDGVIECRNCGNSIEPDCDECSCGWQNPVVGRGLI
jgi:hypothetical protein